MFSQERGCSLIDLAPPGGFVGLQEPPLLSMCATAPSGHGKGTSAAFARPTKNKENTNAITSMRAMFLIFGAKKPYGVHWLTMDDVKRWLAVSPREQNLVGYDRPVRLRIIQARRIVGRARRSRPLLDQAWDNLRQVVRFPVEVRSA